MYHVSKHVNKMKKMILPERIAQMGDEFIFGVATSSFQIEGARALRDDNIWDTFCDRGDTIADGSNGDIACDHYRYWQEDIAICTELGVDAYRFSIAWPRVMRADGTINTAGLNFYNAMVTRLKAQGKRVFVTLYHWDLPQHLEDDGGWLNRQTAYAFADYVRVVCNTLGHHVDAYITINEPFCAGYLGYEVGIHAPGKTSVKAGRQASHHLLLAHGLAMQVIREVLPDIPAGIVLNVHPGYPRTDTDADRRATEQGTDYLFRWYLDPILCGRYPALLDQLPASDQPQIQPGDMDLIGATLDFLGINYYTRNVYAATPDGWFSTVDSGRVGEQPLPTTEMGWDIVPSAFTDVLVQLHAQYRLPPIYITENGAAMPDEIENGVIDDSDRIAYVQTHLDALADAMAYGVDVRGYFTWSLLDNFEWALGYSKRFGLVHVDYATQRRTLKNSAFALRDMLYFRAHHQDT